ncbi:MAG: RHS repeat-associated core domain-containing protein [Candidatus Melainabacteria bacterium]|nr:RHS repeat-associated core domain-containing protein [Candidatus Melainabacteria bacterium]
MLIAANKTGVAASFKYDPFSRLIERTVNTNKTRYVYAGSRLLEEYDSATNTLLKRYVYAGTDEAVIEIDGAGNVTYLHQDHQNSLIARANGAGTLTAKYEYSPWGEASLPGTGLGYTGQRWDADLGLYNYKARYYDPVKGRFLQPDPAGYQQDMNLYTYCVNDPVNLSDPNGGQAVEALKLGLAPTPIGVGISTSSIMVQTLGPELLKSAGRIRANTEILVNNFNSTQSQTKVNKNDLRSKENSYVYQIDAPQGTPSPNGPVGETGIYKIGISSDSDANRPSTQVKRLNFGVTGNPSNGPYSYQIIHGEITALPDSMNRLAAKLIESGEILIIRATFGQQELPGNKTVF